LEISHYADDLPKIKVLKNIYILDVEIDAFLAIGLDFVYNVFFYAGLGIDFHGPHSVPRFKDTVYTLLSGLKTGLDKDEQTAGSL